ncbi:MAG: PAS domain S-box protein [Actinomycetota bacterium]|nr:PAS domain S-box protein [Actinomycetota bacterium]
MSGGSQDGDQTIDVRARATELRNGHDAVLVVAAGPDGRMYAEAANESARTLLRISRAMPQLDDDPPAHVVPLIERIRLALGRDRATSEQLVLRMEDDARVRVDLQLEPLPGSGDTTRLITVVRFAGDSDVADVVTAPGVGVFRTERGIGAVFVDDAFLELLGLAHEQALGHGWLDGIHPDDRLFVDGAMSDAVEHEEGIDIECRVVRSGVDERRTRLRAVPVRDDDARVAGLLASLIDVTDAFQAQQELLRLQRTVEATTDFVTFHGVDGGMFFANEAARAFFGVAAGEPVPPLGPEDFLDISDDEMQQVRDTMIDEGRWAGELDLRGAGGRVMPTSIVVVAHRNAEGDFEYFSALARDISERRAHEAQVTAGTAWFRSIVQNAPDLLTVLGPDGRIRYVSPSAERLIGYPPEELIGTMLSTLVPKEDVALVDSLREAILKSPGQPVRTEGRVLHRDGSTRVLEGSLTNLLDDDIVNGIVLNFRDVTEQRRAELGRRRSETALRAIVQASPLAIVAFDPQGIVHVWNAACEPLFGWSADEVVGVRPPFVADEPAFDALLARVFSGETVTGHAAQYLRVDGAFVDVNVAVAPLRNGTDRVVTAVAVIADESEQRQAERALRQSEVRFRSLVQNSTDIVTVLDARNCVSYASPSSCSFLGLDPDNYGDEPLRGYIHAADLPAVRTLFGRLHADPGATETLTFRMTRADGESRWIEMTATNRLDDPAVRGLITNSRDITDRFEAEETIRSSEARLRALVASASDVISVIDSNGALRYSSPVGEHLLGYETGAGYGENIFDIIHPDDRPRIMELFTMAREIPGMFRPIEVRLERADGSWMHAEVVANNLLNDPSVQGIVITTRDVSERKDAEEALRASEARVRERDARYRAVVDAQTELVCRYLPDSTLTFVNRAFAEFHGRDPEGLVGSKLVDLVPPVERGPQIDRLREFGPEREVQTKEDWEVAADGSVHWYQWTDRAFLGDDGEVLEFQSVGTDVTERRRATMLTAHQAEILEGVARGVPLDQTLRTIAGTVEDHFPRLACAISLLDEDGTTLRIGAAPTLGSRLTDAMDGVRIGPISCSAGTAAYRREPVYVSEIATDPLWIERREVAVAHGIAACWSTPICGSDGYTVLGTLDVFARDQCLPEPEHEQIFSLLAHLASIAIERKEFEERLAHQSMHDPLTGLPNRLLFLDRLGLAVARCGRMHTEVGVLFLDLDRFKNVNDSVGHDAGDELLIAAARRLESLLRPGDTVARFGGDEFAILCEDLPVETSRELVSEISSRLLAAVAQPFIVRGAETFVSASVGIAIASGAERPEELLRDADAAMYSAKESGRGRVMVFDDTMRARALARHATENALHRAIERSELRVFFQPIVSLKEARCVGAEALVRWQHPERGLIAPAEFIPVAEETGLVVVLGEWVLEQAAREAAQWQVEHDQSFLVSVNLSARQLAQPQLVEVVAGVIARTGVLPSNLCLEITESVLMDDAELAMGMIEQVRALGVRLHIDDFGTGYSSLGYLKRFPVDGVKIDRSFVDGLGTDPGDAAIVSAVIGLAHALELDVVAEGVETEEQLAELINLGCDAAQGYFFAPPQPAQDVRDLIGRNRSWRPPGTILMRT